jgi:hypothetical protein
MRGFPICRCFARLPAAALLCGSLLMTLTHSTSAQESGIPVLVEQLAGANVYIRAGTQDGITMNDTLQVYDETGTRYLGELLVISATSSRAVVTFAGEPFSLTRGTTVSIALGGSAPSAATPAVESPRQVDRSPTSPGYPPQVSGRMWVQFNALETTTRWISNEANAVDRTFATPALGLRMTASHLPGDFEFTTNLRGSYRYSSDQLVDPEQSIRVYQMSLVKSFRDMPFQFQAGRFYNRFEDYSGYWDGLSLHYGGRGLGFGVAAGFQPERANEGFSTELPKYTAAVDFNHVGASVTYSTDVSFHHMKQSSGLSDRTFLGWAQRLTVRRARLSTDVVLDRDTRADRWNVTRLYITGSTPVAGRLSLHARYARDEPLLLLDSISLRPLKREQGSVGIGYWARGGSFNLDVTENRVNGRDPIYAFSASFALNETSILGLGFSGAGSYSSSDASDALLLLGGLNRNFGSVQARASYQLYRTEIASSTFVTHNIDCGLVFPLGRRLYSTVQGRLQRGANQRANSVLVNLWMNF